MICECCPDLMVFLSGLFVTDFVLYLSITFLEQVLWKTNIFLPLVVLFPTVFVSCLSPKAEYAFQLYGT